MALSTTFFAMGHMLHVSYGCPATLFVLRVSTEEVRISPAREQEDKDRLNTTARKRKIKKGKDVVQSKRVKLSKVVQTSTSSELGEDQCREHVLRMYCT